MLLICQGALAAVQKCPSKSQRLLLGSSRDSPEVPIYFSAAVAASVDIAPSGIVVYSDIIVNAGDLYAADGRFTCPVGGYYYFHVSVKSDALRVAQGQPML